MMICLPWFRIPVFEWSIPTPAWNRAGLACFALACLLMLRSIGGAAFRWPIRVLVFPAAYFCWESLAQMKVWGTRHLGSVQLDLATINQGLSSLGMEPVTVYDALAWKSLQPDYGWYGTGWTLLLVSVLTWADGPRFASCPRCSSLTNREDGYCFSCGESLRQVPGCTNCGSPAGPEDSFCRVCGDELRKNKE